MTNCRFGKVFAAMMVFTMVLGVLTTLTPIVRADIGEPNDDFATAYEITPGTYTASLGLPGTDADDYYKLTVTAGQTLSVRVTPTSTLGVSLTLYNQLQQYVAYQWWGAKGVVREAGWTTNSAQASYTYYIKVDISDGSGDYDMQVTLASQNDANSGGDAGDALEKPTKIASANATYTGCFLKDDDSNDCYNVTVTAGQTLYAKVTPSADLGVSLTLYNQLKAQVASELWGAKGVVREADWTTNSQQANYFYYIKVDISDGSGTYNMQVTLTSQNDAKSGGDAGDTFAASTQIPSVVATYPGFLKDDDTDDYYKLTVTAGQTLTVKVAPAETLGVSLTLYDPLKEEVASSGWKNPGVNATASAEAETTGTYYIEVIIYDGSGTYTMEVSLTGVLPILVVSVTASPTSIYYGGTSKIKVTVSSAGTAVSAATVTLASDRGGTFSAVTDHANGTYTATFTVPVVTTSTLCTITATATKSGYTSGSGQTTVTVLPSALPILVVSVTASPTTINSGGTSAIRVLVTSAGVPIPAATISLTSDTGGTFSAVTDHANGTYTATFTAPTVTTQTTCTITAAASKTGFTSRSEQTQVTVQPGAGPEIPWILIIIVIIVIVVVVVGVVVAIKLTRKPKP